jgi:hypothetical protein
MDILKAEKEFIEKMKSEHPIGQYVSKAESLHKEYLPDTPDEHIYTQRCKITNFDENNPSNAFEITCPRNIKYNLKASSFREGCRKQKKYEQFKNEQIPCLKVRKKTKTNFDDLNIHLDSKFFGKDDKGREYLEVAFDIEYEDPEKRQDNDDISIEEEETVRKEYHKPFWKKDFLNMGLETFDHNQFQNHELREKWLKIYEEKDFENNVKFGINNADFFIADDGLYAYRFYPKIISKRQRKK